MKPGTERLLVTLMTALGVVGASAGDAPEQNEVLEYQARPQQNVIPDESIPVARPARQTPATTAADEAASTSESTEAPPWQADEARLWRLLQADRLGEVEAGVATLSSRYPEWDPPPGLLRLVEEKRQRRAVTAAEGETLISLSRRYPERFGCREIDNLWRLARAWEEDGAPEQARAVYRRILTECRDPAERLATLQKSAGVFSGEEYLALVEQENSRNPNPALARMALDIRRAAATDAAEADRCADALTLLAPVEAEILAARDEDGARLLGWCYRDSGDLTHAVPWLERAADWSGEPRDSLALAEGLIAAGDQDRALRLLESLAAPDAEAARLARDLWATRATAAMEAGDCRAALDHLAQAERFGPLDAGETRLRGWALYDCGRYAEAAEVFTAAYVQSGDDDAARGLLLSDYQTRDLDHARAVARERSGPLASRFPSEPLPTRGGRIDYDRITLTDDGRLAIITVREWAAFGGAGWSTREGDGPSKLDALRLPIAELEYQYDRHRFEFRATRIDLDSGDMGPGDFPVSTDRITGASITESESGIWEPVASWTIDGDTRWFFEIGASPLEGEVSATWQGRAGGARQGELAGWSLAVVRTPIEESVLSWTGVNGDVEIDGQTVALPFSWGRVTRNGLDANGYRKLGTDWTISGDLRLGRYLGHNVENNTGGQFYGLAEKHLWGDAESGFWAGPYLYLSAFDKNSNQFTPGHGGYFSPSWLVGTGLAGRWRKASGDQSWYMEIRGSAGYQAHEEDATDLIPEDDLEQQVLDLLQLTPDDLGRFGSNSEQGFAGTLEIEGLRRVGASRWYVGGMLRGRISPEFDNAAGMLVVRYGPRQPNYAVNRQFRELFSLHD